MGCASILLKFSALLVALIAIFLGSLYSGMLSKTGVFSLLDTHLDGRGNTFAMGMFPAIHEGTPWGFTEQDMPDLTGQQFIVTGANTGLGYWTTFHLAQAGGSVTLACRSQTKCETALINLSKITNSERLTCRTLDLSSFVSIRAFAQSYRHENSRLDSLVLNAGIMVPPFRLTAEGLESQIGVNHFGHFLLVQELLSLLSATSNGPAGVATVVAVSSAAHYDSYPEGVRLSIADLNDETTYDRAKAYGQSKLANVLFAQELATRVLKDNILVNAIHPGVVDTELGRHIYDAIESVLGGQAADWIMKNVIPGAGRGAWHPRDAALTQVYAAVGPDLKENGLTGKYFHPIARLAPPDIIHTFNNTLQTGLWELSQAFVDAN